MIDWPVETLIEEDPELLVPHAAHGVDPHALTVPYMTVSVSHLGGFR